MEKLQTPHKIALYITQGAEIHTKRVPSEPVSMRSSTVSCFYELAPFLRVFLCFAMFGEMGKVEVWKNNARGSGLP